MEGREDREDSEGYERQGGGTVAAAAPTRAVVIHTRDRRSDEREPGHAGSLSWFMLSRVTFS